MAICQAPPRRDRTWASRICLVLGVLLSLGGTAGAQEVRWRTEYNAARKEAADKGLPLVLDFGTPSCFWCRKLDESTFSDPNVAQLMNEKYVPLKIDAEREHGLVQALRITAYPTVILAASDGK